MEKAGGRPRRFFYGWVVVGISGLVFAVVRGINDAFGVFLVAFVEEFGWSRAAVAGAFSFGRAVEGTVSVAVGMLSDRLGLRRLVPICACLMALGLIMASRIDSLWTLYISYGLVFAIGITGVGDLSHLPVISRWFIRKRGTAIGIAMAGMGLGILLVVPLTQSLILHFGWRWAYIALAVVALVTIIPPTLLFQREHPEDMGLLADGEVSDEPGAVAGALRAPPRRVTSPAHDWTLRAAMATPTLWLLFATRVMTPLGMMMVVPHHVVYLVEHGFDKLTAAFAFGSLGAFSFTGRVVFGALSDRIGRVPTICLTYGLSIVGTLLLMSLHHPAQRLLLWCHIVIYGLGFGARGPVTSSLVIDLFHGKHYGAILGFLEIGSGLGGTIGPWLSGLLFDRTGSYALSFSVSMAVLVLATVSAWLAGRWGRATD
ncbi:MAG TPA: MFS transporter [Candidatus Tectomicrobia bacterium]|nr:MFS transporter [Candidatus Tectomicrobia bacterium]